MRLTGPSSATIWSRDAAGSIDGPGGDAPQPPIAFCAQDEEGAGEGKPIKSDQVHEASIHDVDGTGLANDHIGQVGVVGFAMVDMDDHRDVATQIDHGVELHRTLVMVEAGPREERQAQIDGGGVQGIGSAVEIGAEAVVRIEPPSLVNQDLCEGRIEPPVATLIGIGERAAPDLLADAHKIELRPLGVQTGHRVAKAVAIGQLRESHAADWSWQLKLFSA